MSYGCNKAKDDPPVDLLVVVKGFVTSGPVVVVDVDVVHSTQLVAVDDRSLQTKNSLLANIAESLDKPK